jgi:hypothetical protein
MWKSTVAIEKDGEPSKTDVSVFAECLPSRAKLNEIAQTSARQLSLNVSKHRKQNASFRFGKIKLYNVTNRNDNHWTAESHD